MRNNKDNKDFLEKNPDTPEGEDFAKLFEEQSSIAGPTGDGDIFLAKVVAKEGDVYLLDVGAKSEAPLAATEIPQELTIAAGALLPVMFVGRGREEGSGRRLSFRAALRNLQRETIQNHINNKTRLKARVFRFQGNGFFAGIYVENQRFPDLPPKLWKLMPFPAFLPVDQIDQVDPRPLQRWMAKILDVKVTSIDSRGTAIVSRRKVLEEDKEALRQETLSKTKEGNVLVARIKEVAREYVMLDIHGVEAYLSQTEASWYKQVDLGRFFRRGENLEVKILQSDKEKNRFVVSHRALLRHPADDLVKMFKVGATVEAEVVRVLPRGSCFVRLPGSKREAYIPDREMDNDTPIQVGSKVKAMVTGIDRENIRVILSPKKYEHVQIPQTIAKYARENQPIRLGELLKEE